MAGFAAVLANSCYDEDQAKRTRLKNDFQFISSALKTYAINTGRPPSTEQGLTALVIRPTLDPLPVDWVQVMSKAPIDPWQQPYHYRELPAVSGIFRWELRTGGPDGKLWTTDDRQTEFDWKPAP